MSEKFIIRPMAESDFTALKPLMRELHAVHSDARPDFYTVSDDPLDEAAFGYWFGEDKHAFVAEQDGELLGFLTGYIVRYAGRPLHQPMIHFYVDTLGVTASARRRGIGKALMQAAERVGKEAGADRMTLGVWAFNRGARDFYEDFGFVEREIRMEYRF